MAEKLAQTLSSFLFMRAKLITKTYDHVDANSFSPYTRRATELLVNTVIDIYNRRSAASKSKDLFDDRFTYTLGLLVELGDYDLAKKLVTGLSLADHPTGSRRARSDALEAIVEECLARDEIDLAIDAINLLDSDSRRLPWLQTAINISVVAKMKTDNI